MTKITLKGNPIHTVGQLPIVGSKAPEFTLAKSDLSDISLSDYKGKRVVLSIFPSLDTGICAAAVRRFNKEVQNLDNTVVICASMDLPFAHSRFCVAEGLENVISASIFRNPEFGQNYGVTQADGPMRGLMSRAVVVINEEGKVIYTEQVPEIAQEPDYEKAIAVL
jgi:thioredoxin-dependent peroxiredoxin